MGLLSCPASHTCRIALQHSKRRVCVRARARTHTHTHTYINGSYSTALHITCTSVGGALRVFMHSRGRAAVLCAQPWARRGSSRHFFRGVILEAVVQAVRCSGGTFVVSLQHWAVSCSQLPLVRCCLFALGLSPSALHPSSECGTQRPQPHVAPAGSASQHCGKRAREVSYRGCIQARRGMHHLGCSYAKLYPVNGHIRGVTISLVRAALLVLEGAATWR